MGITRFLSFALILLYLRADAQPLPQKLSLVVLAGSTSMTVNNQPLSKLPTDKDSALLRQTLEDEGFKYQLLTGHSATLKNVYNALHYLLAEATTGAEVIVVFRSHGETIPDAGRLDERDGTDEVLLMLQGYITDDTLGFFLGGLQRKVGATGSVTLIVDACHAGTMARGFKSEFVPPQVLEVPKSVALKNTVCFYSTTADRHQFGDDQAAGAIIQAFCKEYPETDQNSTFRGLFDKMRYFTLEYGTGVPYAEGDGLDRYIQSKRPVCPPFHFTVMSSDHKINATVLDGVAEGTKVKVFSTDTHDTERATPLFETIIHSVGLHNAEIRIPPDVPLEKVVGAWVVPNDPVQKLYNSSTIHVQFDGLNTDSRAAVLEQVRDLLHIDQKNDSPRLVIGQKSNGRIFLKEEPGNPGFQFDWADNASTMDSLRIYILKYAQAKYLAGLQIDSPNTAGVELFLLKGANKASAYNDRDSILANTAPRLHLESKSINSKVALLTICPSYNVEYIKTYDMGEFLSTLKTPRLQMGRTEGQWTLLTIAGEDVQDFSAVFPASNTKLVSNLTSKQKKSARNIYQIKSYHFNLKN